MMTRNGRFVGGSGGSGRSCGGSVVVAVVAVVVACVVLAVASGFGSSSGGGGCCRCDGRRWSWSDCGCACPYHRSAQWLARSRSWSGSVSWALSLLGG